ncbi:MAG: amidophosphoribosyltransferase [Chloroflexi bacterium]|nr:amidophosphoribosyltransferase [Anaerolineaceae bacterium]NMB87836.1 amidophosphoribosyltransferase [Chloroflexota bacterium]
MSKQHILEPQDHRPHEECGIVGVFAPNENVATMAYFALFAMQHRGQDAAGIAVSNGFSIRMHKDVGLVSQVFDADNLQPLQGHYAIGHTRYSTTGSPNLHNAQPFLLDTLHGPIAVAHNGNLVNSAALRQELLERGVGLSSTTDSEVIAMMLAGARGSSWNERIRSVMKKWVGAYSLVILTRTGVYVVRDPWGFRPLNVGLLPGGGHAAASESCALQTLGCLAIREVKPGEIVALSDSALTVQQALPPKSRQAACTFEFIYFSRPDSYFNGKNIHLVRQQLGQQLAEESPVEADVVIPVPDSAIPGAIGYAARSGIPYNDGLVVNRYIGRTFIQPTESLRHQDVGLKFIALPANIRDRRVVVVDDSIVRGTTTEQLIRLLREAGAREVHMRITCPPIRHPCYMGVDMGTYEELLAHHMDEEEMRAHIGADSLAFLSLPGMMAAIGDTTGYCNACFTGRYPLSLPPDYVKSNFEARKIEDD